MTMGDMRGEFDAYNDAIRERKEATRARNEELLRATGLPWGVGNDGAHWMLRGSPTVDVYPGTGRWRVGSRRGRGVEGLLAAMQGKAG